MCSGFYWVFGSYYLISVTNTNTLLFSFYQVIYLLRKISTHKYIIQECHICMNSELVTSYLSLCLTAPVSAPGSNHSIGDEGVARWCSFQTLLCTFWFSLSPVTLCILFVPLCLSLSGTSPHLGLFPPSYFPPPPFVNSKYFLYISPTLTLGRQKARKSKVENHSN